MDRSVLIVDDHPGFRAQARRLLACEGYRVIGEAADCGTAYECALRLAPEVALVDVHLPDGTGFELAQRLRAMDAAPLVILISSRDSAELEPCVSASPARGFIAKAELSRTTIEDLLP
ncbi:MAG TPA: response regulator transcription factor [Solirubrobacterales bacterium]|nr:response regulator transcription factor [Solirubrobacterales bacterium]